VVFDPYASVESAGIYRFGSVGQDGRLLLWEFSQKILTRPRGNSAHSVTFLHNLNIEFLPSESQRRFSMLRASADSNGGSLASSGSSAPASPLRLSTDQQLHSHFVAADPQTTVWLPAIKWKQLNYLLEPLVNQRVHLEPVSDLVFLQDCLVTVCWAAILKFWYRPNKSAPLLPQNKAQPNSSDSSDVDDDNNS
jgi:hypothetical protein